MLKCGLLVSGKLGQICLQSVMNSVTVSCIFTDKNSQEIIEAAAAHNIPCFVGNPRNEKAKEFIGAFDIDVILSINYLFLVTADIFNHATQYAVNFHGSLLPKYRGRSPHIWAIINNEKETGITAHLMTEGCDEGDIVEQLTIPIAHHHTGADILEIFGEQYPVLVNTVIEKIKNNTLQATPQNHEKATFFGKRTPEDGLINWNWQRERIHNWVRAQAHPYPGAFTHYNGVKIRINEVRFDDTGFDYNEPNGKVLSANPLVIKTPNGGVELEDWIADEVLMINKGDILHD